MLSLYVSRLSFVFTAERGYYWFHSETVWFLSPPTSCVCLHRAGEPQGQQSECIWVEVSSKKHSQSIALTVGAFEAVKIFVRYSTSAEKWQHMLLTILHGTALHNISNLVVKDRQLPLCCLHLLVPYTTLSLIDWKHTQTHTHVWGLTGLFWVDFPLANREF